MKVPTIFVKYKKPYEKQDFLCRYFYRHDENLIERWTIRKFTRWLRDFKLGTQWGYTREEDPFKVVFG